MMNVSPDELKETKVLKTASTEKSFSKCNWKFTFNDISAGYVVLLLAVMETRRIKERIHDY